MQKKKQSIATITRESHQYTSDSELTYTLELLDEDIQITLTDKTGKQNKNLLLMIHVDCKGKGGQCA